VIDRIFQSSRFLVLVAVFATALSSLLMYFSSLSIIYHILMDFFSAPPATADQGKVLAVKLLKLLDLLLIGITLHVISVSLYRLFITPLKVGESKFLVALHIKNFHDLKITLVQVTVVILVILFLEHAVEVGASLETLYFGAAIALMIAASTFAWRWME
jgi:uncharacterized membrane protein YqhA